MYYYFADQVGSTRTITDANGKLCYDAEFTPYGQEISHTERLQTTACPPGYKFTGYERDPETGLDYAFARYYNPALGRFLSPDPLGGSLGDPQSLNRYAYTGNDPANSTDPSGMVNVANYRPDGGGAGIGGLLNISLGLLGANGGFGSGWSEFDLLAFAFTPTGTQQVPCPSGDDCGRATEPVYGNIGALALFGVIGYDPSIPYLYGPQPPPPPRCSDNKNALDDPNLFWADNFASPAQVDAFFQSTNAPATWDGYDAATAFQSAGINPGLAVGIIGAETSFGNIDLGAGNIAAPFSSGGANFGSSLSRGLGVVTKLENTTFTDSTPLTALINEQNSLNQAYEGDQPPIQRAWKDHVNSWFLKFAKFIGACR